MKKTAAIIRMLEQGKSYADIQQKLRVSPSRISMLKKQLQRTPAAPVPSDATTTSAATSATTRPNSLSVAEIIELGKNVKFILSNDPSPFPTDPSPTTTFVEKCCLCGKKIFTEDIVYLDVVGSINWYTCSKECCIKYYRKRYNAIPVFN